MFKFLSEAAEKLSYGMYTYLLIALMLAAGVTFTLRTRGVQLRLLREAIRVTGEKPKGRDGVSAFDALMVSTASRVGTGNILGVAGAILVGGYGSVFWMWLIALLGGATAFVESTLAQIYKQKDPRGGFYGGPAYYIQRAMGGRRGLSAVFCVCLLLTYGVGFNLLTSYNLQSAFETYSFYVPGVSGWLIGGAAAILCLCCALGGGKGITRVTGVLVPLMGLLYVAVALAVTLIHLDRLPLVFGEIFRSAFDGKAIFGGFAGSCVMMGVRRGLFSNEAGVGSAPNAAAAADVTHPVKQGLTQMLSVFIDTLVLCTATACMVMSTGVSGQGVESYSVYIQSVLRANFGPAGTVFLTVSLFLFAFTTLVGNFFYIDNCVAFLAGKMPSERVMTWIRAAAAAVIALGGGLSMGAAWNIADILMGVMCLINIPVLFRLSKTAAAVLRDYERQRRAGQDPVFHPRELGIEGAEAWEGLN
ncbi:MAG: alanine/glycine:cation symporter family protein [Oscillospiraceae bacterium]